MSNQILGNRKVVYFTTFYLLVINLLCRLDFINGIGASVSRLFVKI